MTKRPDTLLIATHNAGKLDEMRDLLAPYGIAVRGAAELNLAEPEETETTFIGNARIKAHAAAQATGLPALADDSGLAVDALDGAPGVYTADWAETETGRDFLMAMEKVRAELLQNNAQEPWHAQFHCTLVLAFPDGTDHVFQGIMPGTLTWPLRGALGHGFDPMFVPNGYTQTFAEMTADEKNSISHRAKAFQLFIDGYLDA